MEFTRYDHGTPCWIDMASPDVDGSKTFYTSLFGWDAEDQFDPEGSYIYTMMKLGGKDVAGLGGQMSEEMAGMPAIWNTYIAVDDVEQVVKNAEAAGGSVIVPPMDVMDSGRMAVCMDPTGAAICMWQAGTHIGAQLVNEPNTFSWNELMTRDLATAKTFYTEVLGWQYEVQDMGPAGEYTVIEGGENNGLGGMMDMPDDVPAEVPSYWGVYFTVEDTAAMVEKAKGLGANVMFGPQEMEGVGTLATLADPQGGTFSLMQPAQQS